MNQEGINSTTKSRGLSSVPPDWQSLFNQYSTVLPSDKWETLFFQFSDAFSMIPHDWRELFFQYLVLTMKYTTLNETIWQKEFSTFKSSASAEFSNPDSPNLFEKNPITYLLYAHNTLVNFPHDLNRILKLIQQQRRIPLTKTTFLTILDTIWKESETKNWLTPVLKELFRTMILYPLASPKELAKRLNTTPSIVRERIARFRTRFHISRVIQLNYYKVGLSRVYLFLRFKNRKNHEPALPVTPRYFEKEVTFCPDTLADLFSIQSYYLPKAQWSAFYKLCENRFDPNKVAWLGDAPRFFFADDVTLLYNTNTYDPTTRTWRVNEEYLSACLFTDLWEHLPRLDISPALHLSYDINSPRLHFDQLDLKIAHYFYELEGNNNRFSTVGAVAKELDIPFLVVKSRLQRMLETNMVAFYYLTTFRLPRSIRIVLLSENPAIYEQFLSIASHLPVVSATRIHSYPAKYVGVFSICWLPSGSRVPYIFRDFFKMHRDVITGFCAESRYVIVPKRPLWQHWDPVRKRWRWRDLLEPEDGFND